MDWLRKSTFLRACDHILDCHAVLPEKYTHSLRFWVDTDIFTHFHRDYFSGMIWLWIIWFVQNWRTKPDGFALNIWCESISMYVTPTDSSSMQELLMQEHKQNLYKTYSGCGRDTWHIESKIFLQPPNYLIIIVNRITYSNNSITKNKSRIHLDLYIELGPYKFSLQASVDHHGYSMNSGHYTASINCCGKTFHCNDNKITECNITDTYNSSTAYILLYKLMVC